MRARRLRLLRICLSAVSILMAAGGAASGAPQGMPPAEITRRIDAEYPRLEALYRELHAQPELSLQEEKTAARLVRELRALGLEVTDKIGGHGVVGILRNGPGPTVMVRTDMDALPVVEQTGLPYASTVRARDAEGKDVGVMHACGHDVHMACWVGTARLLAGLKERWRGTVLFVAQPAEEIVAGARSMLAQGLFKRFPKPDCALALHVFPLPHGTVGCREGPVMAGADSVDIVVRGRGGHGAAPHLTIDPIVLAARIVLDLQTLVSREIDPTDPAVVTVGSIHGGTKRNIIPDEVRLLLTVRSQRPAVREQLLQGIARIARSAAQAAGAPEPTVTVSSTETVPPTVNDPALARKITALFREVIGSERVLELTPLMVSEDFSLYGREGVPTFFYALGIYPPERIAEARRPGGPPLPSNHSDRFSPVPEPTLKTGILTMTTAVLHLLER